jgi:hypothetical protein
MNYYSQIYRYAKSLIDSEGEQLVMPVDPPVSKNDADLVAVLALLVEKHLQSVAKSSALLALHFGFTAQYVHPVDF